MRLLLLLLFPWCLLTACPSAPPDAPSDDDAPPTEGPPLGEPHVVPTDQHGEWVWIDVPGMRCSVGEGGGFAVNFTDASRDLVIYLQGGGICYDAFTCLFGGAATSVGVDPLRTALDGSIRANTGIFDRTDEDNPFRDANFVVVPHCTGDHHTGDKVTDYGGAIRHHVGYTNITRMLERVVPTFRDAGRVVLSGFSAGGVGIAANYHQLAAAFESQGLPSPFLMIDAGPFMRPPHLSMSGQAGLRASWRLERTVGSFCASCLSEGFHDISRANAALHPCMRSSLICSDADSVVTFLFSVLTGGSTFGPAEMRAGLDDLADWFEAQEEA